MKPFEYNAISRHAVRRLGYPFDLLAVQEGSSKFFEYVDFFSKVNPDKHSALTTRSRKGMLRIVL